MLLLILFLKMMLKNFKSYNMNRANKRNFYAVVVVYNKNVVDSETIKGLSRIKNFNINVVVFDNSTLDFNNKFMCDSLGIGYLSFEKNLGLSKAYNLSLDHLRDKIHNDDILIWFDDDTEITEDYFSSLYVAEQDLSVDVFLPIIKGQNGLIYSPNSACFVKNKLFTISNLHSIKKINAINSCLAMRYRLFSNYRYDENLFLDSVDQNFFEDMRKVGIKYSILPVVVNQNFSQRGEYIDCKALENRIKIRIRDLMVYARKKSHYSLLAVIKAMGWGVMFSIRCRSIRFFFISIKYCLLGVFSNVKYFLKSDC